MDFICPRCEMSVTSEFYGPCESCRAALRAKFVAVRIDVEVADYEPKMNVTPNGVALKGD